MTTWAAAARFCAARRAFLIVDAPANWDVPGAVDAVDDFIAIDRNHAALYFPRLLIPDPLQENELEDFAPCGAVAGVISRTDATRGVWKAPAGIEARLEGVRASRSTVLEGTLTDSEIGRLNPLGVNCLRAFPVIGHVVWGARTLEGADALGVAVEVRAGAPAGAVHRGEPRPRHAVGGLRAERRAAVGADPAERRRVHARALPPGRLPGNDAEDAYFVKCDSETTTQADIDNGVVNIVVGFAPLKPAEFVVISIRQIYCRS